MDSGTFPWQVKCCRVPWVSEICSTRNDRHVPCGQEGERERRVWPEASGDSSGVSKSRVGRMVQIVPMTWDDLPEVLAIERESQAEPWSERSFGEELARPETWAFVARLSGTWGEGIEMHSRGSVGLNFPTDHGMPLCGYVCFWIVADELQIMNIAVHRSFRRRGIGWALLSHALGAGVASGARRAFLEVRKSNGGARKLYEKAGFSKVGERPGYYGLDQEAAVLMEMVLYPPDSDPTSLFQRQVRSC